MKTRKILALALSLVMVFALCGNAFAYHLTNEVTELEQTNSDISEKLAEETYVLLENNGVLPIAKEGKIALFGSASETTIKGGTGSGDVNQRAHDNIGQAFEAAGYEIANPTWFARMAASRAQGGCGGSGPKNDILVTDEELAEATAASDTCIYAIARNAGEGSDRRVDSGNGSYMLTETELANVAKLSAAFKNFIVVYNTLTMDTSWQEGLDIDAVVYMCNGGQRGSEALVNVLNGNATPSGKLSDTWALQYSDYPAAAGFANADGNTMTEYYEEGIYMGYRYFDTFGLDVKYPFGYGLSYTDFDIAVDDVRADGEYVNVDVTVTNIGTKYAGKEVVEVYFSAPDGELEKPYQELATYGKTDLLQPLQAQSMTLNFKTSDMSSYCEDEASYIMEAGDYVIRVGNSSRNTVAAAVITLDEKAVTEIMFNQVQKEENAVLNELSKEGATPIANNDEAELADAIKIALKAADIETVDHRPDCNDDETAYVYLFSDEAASYVPRKDITIRTRTVAGIINNAENPEGPRFNGYSTTTYDEEVVDVGTLPEGITKENAKLSDVINGKITLEQFVACLTPEEMARLCVGGAGQIIEAPDGTQVGAAATSVQGGAGQTTYAFIETRHIPSMPNADGPAGIRITQSYSLGAADMNRDNEISGRGRYVKINFSNLATSYGASTYEIGVYSGETNVALNKTVTASSIQTNSGTLLEPAFAVDGDNNTRWGSDYNGGDNTAPWIQIDLGQVYDLNRLTILFEAAYARTYEVQVSEDGENFTSIFTYEAPSNTAYQFCTAFPVGTNIAMSWDTDVALAFGTAYGSEMKEYGVTTCLCPGMDMHRDPLGGRNFEYYSEDPLVSGLSAGYFTLGVQSHDGIGVCLKHYWGNEQEDNRNALNNVISERTARELYLKQFEIAVKLAHPQTVMNCYNENNGWPGSDSWDCNEDILRGEWGFTGYVMTDWGGGQSTAYVAKHGGCDMVMPGGNANVILQGYTVAEPAFNEDGSIRNQGNFVFDVNQGEPPTYTVETNLASADDAPDSVKEAVEAGYASIFMRGGKVNVGWYGQVSDEGKISIGDLQKSSLRVLGVAMLSQDMVGVMRALGDEDFTVGSYSAETGAEACAEDFVPFCVKNGDPADVDAIYAASVEADNTEADTVDVPVSYKGEGVLTTARLEINCDLDIAEVTSDFDFEFNPENGRVIVYLGDGTAIGDTLFTITFNIAGVEDSGVYPVDLTLIEATDNDGALIDVLTVDGEVDLTVAPKLGDVNMDGEVDNRDLIMIARYLVDLVQFNAEQMILADFNEDGLVNNTDLVLISRFLVGA